MIGVFSVTGILDKDDPGNEEEATFEIVLTIPRGDLEDLINAVERAMEASRSAFWIADLAEIRKILVNARAAGRQARRAEIENFKKTIELAKDIGTEEGGIVEVIANSLKTKADAEDLAEKMKAAAAAIENGTASAADAFRTFGAIIRELQRRGEI